MERWIYPLGALVFGFACLFVIYIYARRRKGGWQAAPWLSFVLIWPLILDADKQKRNGQFLTRRELVGWGLVVLIAIVAIALTPPRGG